MRKITRKKDIPERLGLGRTAVNELIAAGLIRVFPLTPGGRAKAAFDDELEAYLVRKAESIDRDQQTQRKRAD